jgi:hypothetical protein
VRTAVLFASIVAWLLFPCSAGLQAGSRGGLWPAQKHAVGENATRTSSAGAAYLGFDRNDYPGDARLAALRRTFSFTAYWLNNPPGTSSNTWKGKRRTIASAGFGFLVVFNGRVYRELTAGDAAAIGAQDATAAVLAAQREGFLKGTVIFLDQEEGGRLLPEQRAYLHAWVDGVNADGFRAGVYCSGLPSPESGGAVVVTAEDIRANANGRSIRYWVTADACPPSPGCSFSKPVPRPGASGVEFAEVWQFAQSPRRPQYTAACRRAYSKDGNCYPPKPRLARIDVDLDAATSPDPSER